MQTVLALLNRLRPHLQWLRPWLLRSYKRLEETRERLNEIKDPINQCSYDLYRCHSCNRFFTKAEEIEIYLPEHPNYGRVCPCGSHRYHPIDDTYLRWWEFLTLRFWRFILLRIGGIV